MNPQTQKLALALSLGMALAACGGGDGNNTTPESSATTKATPADTSSSEAAPSTTAATQDAATAQNTAGAQNSSAPAQTNEAASAPIQWNDTNGIVTVRGDLVIQALLSQAGPLDAQQQPQVYPLHFERTGKTAGSGEPSGDMIMLVTADITPDNGNTGLGSNLLELDLARGPAYGPLENARAAPNAIHQLPRGNPLDAIRHLTGRPAPGQRRAECTHHYTTENRQDHETGHSGAARSQFNICQCTYRLQDDA